MAGEPSAEPEGRAEQQIQVPRLEIGLQGVGLNIGTAPGGDRLLMIGPLLVTFLLPLEKEGAREVARHLVGGIEVASKIPRMDIPKGG